VLSKKISALVGQSARGAIMALFLVGGCSFKGLSLRTLLSSATAKEFPKLVLRVLEDVSLRGVEVLSSAVDVKLSMDMADWSGVPFRRMLSSVERLSDSAIFLGSFQVNTSGSRSSALLRFATSADQRRGFDVLFSMVYV